MPQRNRPSPPLRVQAITAPGVAADRQLLRPVSRPGAAARSGRPAWAGRL